jgi:two-component system, NtrC family, sensor kinase
MKLAAKLMLVFFAVVILLTGGAGYFAVWHGFSRIERQQIVYAQRIAQELQQQLETSEQHRIPDGIVQILQQNGTDWQQLRIRWVWFDRGVSDQYRPQVAMDQLAEAIEGRVTTRTFYDESGVRHLLTYCPIDTKSGRRGGLELAESLQSLDEQAYATLVAGLASIGAMAVAGVLVCWLIGVRWVGYPLERLIDKTHRVGQGDFSEPLHLKGHDELGQLAAALNEMCRQLDHQQQRIHSETTERLAAMEQLRHADRLKTVGRLAAGIAHELGTPLNVVSGRAGLIASGKLTDEEIQQSARTIKSEADRITGIIRQLLDFARRRSPQRSQIDLREVARQTTQLLEPLASKRGVALHVEGNGQPVMACADFAQIQQVVTNLVMNAIQAMEHGGDVRVRLGSELRSTPEASDDEPASYAVLTIEDQGVGIAPEDLAHIFEPFFTTKQVGEGTGLGLSIADGIIREHGGWMEVESRPGQGSRFTMFLPDQPC